MHCLYVSERRMPAIEQVIAERDPTDVTIQPAFLGRVLIWCQSEASHRALAGEVERTDRELAT